MWNEFHEFYDVELLKTLVISEIEDNNDRYRRHYNGTLFDLLKGVYDYVKYGKYSQDCVDLCVDAACRILNINIGIFQSVGGLAQCINYKAERPTNRDIFLLYNNDHYESIMFSGNVNVKADKFKKPTIEDIGSDYGDDFEYGVEENFNEKGLNKKSQFPCKSGTATRKLGSDGAVSPVVKDFMEDVGILEDESTWKYQHTDSDNQESPGKEGVEGKRKWLPHRNFHQSDSDIDDPHFSLSKSSTKDASMECIDLTSDYYSKTQTTDSSTSTSMPEYPEYREKPLKYSKWPINNHLMSKVVAKVVDDVPWDIDGNCKFIVRCCSENLPNKTSDGRWFICKLQGGKFRMSSKRWVIARGHTYVNMSNALNVHMKTQLIALISDI